MCVPRGGDAPCVGGGRHALCKVEISGGEGVEIKILSVYKILRRIYHHARKLLGN